MNEIAWRVDAVGSLVGPRLHDARLVAVECVMGGRLTLRMQRLAGELVRLDGEGLRELTVTELWDDAIVSDLFVWSAGAVPEETWSLPDAGWNALFRGRVSPDQARAAAQRIVGRRPDPLLLVLSCSYGGQLAAVIDRLTATEEPLSV